MCDLRDADASFAAERVVEDGGVAQFAAALDRVTDP